MARQYPPARRGHSSAGGVSLVVLAGLIGLGILTDGGRAVLTGFVGFAQFYAGVFTLVSLSLTVIAGLVATDRVLLLARHRMWIQSVHRSLGIIAITFLVLHIGTEVAASRVGLLGALIPFTSAPVTVGIGTIAAYFMVTVMWTGIVRARFAQNGRAWLWRPLHALAYLAWPVALAHGLSAGRPAAVWVMASYFILMFLTTVALGLRLSAERHRRRQQLSADRTTTSIAPVGRAVPTPSSRRAGRRPGFRWAAPPAEQSWQEQELFSQTGSFRSVPPPSYRDEPAATTYRSATAVLTEPSWPPRDVYEPPTATTYGDPVPPSLRDRFATRRARAEQAEPEDRYPDADPPSLINLDTHRSARRQPRDVEDEGYWAQLRGEAR